MYTTARKNDFMVHFTHCMHGRVSLAMPSIAHGKLQLFQGHSSVAKSVGSFFDTLGGSTARILASEL